MYDIVPKAVLDRIGAAYERAVRCVHFDFTYTCTRQRVAGLTRWKEMLKPDPDGVYVAQSLRLRVHKKRAGGVPPQDSIVTYSCQNSLGSS